MCEINQKMFFTVKGEYLSLGLKPGELLLYAYIKNFKGKNKCSASNEYLGTMFDVGERTVQLWLKNLKEKELIETIYENGQRILK